MIFDDADVTEYHRRQFAIATQTLRKLTVTEIVRGVEAFYQPRYCEEGGTCFVNEVLREVFPSANKMGSYNQMVNCSLPFILRDISRPEFYALSVAFEVRSLRNDFKGECLRELAERGAAPEAAPQEATCSATM